MSQRQNLYISFLVGFLAFLPILAVEAPRFLAFGPAGAGLVFMAIYPFVLDQKINWQKISWLWPAFFMTGGLVILALLSAFWAPDADIVFDRVKKMTPLLVFGSVFLSLSRSLQWDMLKNRLWLIPCGLVAASLVIFFEFMMDAPLYRLLRGMETEEYLNYSVFNRAAVVCVLCFFSGLALLKSYISPVKAFAVMAVGFLPMLFVVESQSAQFSFVVGLIFMFFFPYRHKAAWIILMGFVAVLGLFAPFVSIWAFQNIAMDMQSLPLVGVKGGFAGNRLEIWDYVSRYMLQSPLYGYGIEASRAITDFDSGEVFQKGTSILHPHNFMIQFWLEFGVIGALAGVSACNYIIWSVYRHATTAQAKILLPTMVATMFVASVGYGFWQGWWLGLLFLAAGFCFFAIKAPLYKNPS